MRSGVRATFTLPQRFHPVARLLLERGVQLDAVLAHARHVAVRPHLPDEPGGVPRGAAGELALLEQQHVGDAELRQVIGGGAAGDAAADDQDLGVGGKGHRAVFVKTESTLSHDHANLPLPGIPALAMMTRTT
jgi:hypothetical protein